MDKLNKFKFNQSHPCISEGPIKAIIKPFEASQKSVKICFLFVQDWDWKS